MNELRISANEGTHYFEVALCDSVEEAKADVASYGGHDEFNAIVVGRVYKTPPTEGCLGRIVFSAPDFAPSIVQHELLHAAMLYERNVFGNTTLSFADIEVEERLAYTQQSLLDELLFAMDEAGLAEFGTSEPEQPQPAYQAPFLNDSNSVLQPDGSRLYPIQKPRIVEANARLIAERAVFKID